MGFIAYTTLTTF